MDTKSRREQQKERRRQEIIMEALVLFKTESYHKASLDRLAEMIGIAKGTIYNYVKSKEDLLYQCMIYLIEELNDIFRKNIIIEMELKEILQTTAELMFKFFQDYQNVFAIYKKEIIDKSSTDSHTYKQNHFKKMFKSIKLFINFLAKKFQKNGLSEDPEIVFSLIFSAVIGYSHQYLHLKDLKVVKHKIHKAIDLIYKGLTAA